VSTIKGSLYVFQEVFMADQPLACDLFALSAAQRERHAALIGQLAQAVEQVEEVSDGYVITYGSDGAAWSSLTEWIDLERRCCPFLSFTLRLVPGEPLTLHLTGPDGVKAFLAEELSGLVR
jgi:hypothetical protein